MNLDSFFPTKKDKEEAISQLKHLISTPGWKIIVNLLENDIERIDNDLRVKSFEDVSEVKELQNKRAYLVILKQLPRRLAEELSDEGENEIDFEIY